MYKKSFLFILLLTLSLGLFTQKTKADMGPKSTAVIEVIGITEDYYLDILILSNHIIEPLNSDDLENKISRNYYMDIYPSHILNGYQDNDGYTSRTLFSGPPATLIQNTTNYNIIKIGYFQAPTNFKIAIVLKDGTLLKSKIIDRRLFNSEITFDLTGVDLTYDQSNIGTIKEIIPYMFMTTSLIIRVIITILVEAIILYLFMYRSKNSLKLIGITNLVTQTILTFFMIISFYYWLSIFGLIAALVLGEIGVFTAETIIYRLFLKEHSKKRAIAYAIVANLVSLLLTILTISLF